MAIQFLDILSTILTPGAYVEFDNSGASLPPQGHKILIVGMLLASGTKPEGELVQITQADQGELYFGAGSQLESMIRKAKRIDPDTEMLAIGLAEDAGGAAAGGSIAFSGTATAAGSAKLSIAGQLVEVPIAIGDTPTEVVATAVTRITAATSLPVTAADADPSLTITCKWKGETGNDIDIRVNYFQADALPPGISAVVTPMSGGTTDPDLQTALDALGDTQFHTIICGITSTANLTKLKDLLDLRWGGMVALEGHAFIGHCSKSGTTKANALTAGIAVGTAHNSPLLTVMEGGVAPSPPWEWAAVTGAIDAKMTQLDVNRPRQTTKMTGLLPPRPEFAFNRAERQLLLEAGVSTHTVSVGEAFVERLVTTYTKNAQNFPDDSYQDVIDLRSLAYIRYSLRGTTSLRYGQHKLARDSFIPPPGSRVVRPKDIRAMVIGLARTDWAEKTIVQNLEALKKGLIVELHNDDPATGRINTRLPVELIRGFRVAAYQVAFT